MKLDIAGEIFTVKRIETRTGAMKVISKDGKVYGMSHSNQGGFSFHNELLPDSVKSFETTQLKSISGLEKELAEAIRAKSVLKRDIESSLGQAEWEGFTPKERVRSVDKIIEDQKSYTYKPADEPLEIWTKSGDELVGTVIKEGDNVYFVRNGKRYDIPEDGAVYGRHLDTESDVVSSVSREHVRISRDGEYVNIESLNPLNGTKIKGAEMKVDSLNKAEVLKGQKGKGLAESMETAETPHGDRIAAATDEGVGYKEWNEDRIVVDPESGMVGAIDGMGGVGAQGSGERAAQVFAEEMKNLPDNIPEAIRRASERLKAEKCDGAACFASGRVFEQNGAKYLEAFSAGDSKCIIFDKNGNIKFQTIEESQVAEWVKNGGLSPDEALFHPNRNYVTGGVDARSTKIRSYQPQKLESGDRVIFMSDGISDNLTSSEIWKLMKGKTPEDAVKVVSDVTDARMRRPEVDYYDPEHPAFEKRRREGQFDDGYKSQPKKDNRAFAVMDIS